MPLIEQEGPATDEFNAIFPEAQPVKSLNDLLEEISHDDSSDGFWREVGGSDAPPSTGSAKAGAHE